MKKYVTHPLIAVATLFSTTSGSALEFEFQGNNIKPPEISLVDFVRINDITDEMLQDILLGKLQNMGIEFPENEQLPLEIFLGGDLISLVNTSDAPIYIEFKKSVFLRNFNGKLFLSTDLHHWKPMEQFVTGKIQVGLSVEENEGPTISLGAELYERVSPYEIVD